MKRINKNLLIIIQLVVIGVLVYLWNSSRLKSVEQVGLVESLNAELVTWKDKDSLNNAKIQVIETSNSKTFTQLKTTDSLVMELQGLVKSFDKRLKKSGSATILKTETKYDTIFSTVGLSKDSLSILLPYNFSKKDKWIEYSFNIERDKTKFDLKVKNDYEVVIGREKTSMFKSKPYVEVKNKNPYTETTALRTYQVILPKPKKIGIGPLVGYGVGANFQAQPFIGIGVQYNLIRF